MFINVNLRAARKAAGGGYWRAFFNMEINFKNTAEYNMNKFSSLSSWLLLSASAALIGCGGGGGGGSNPPPAVSSATASSVTVTSSSSSAPATTQLTIQGMAVAGALAGGEVAVTIGSNTYKATIDNVMKYNITLAIPNQDAGKPFVAIATGATSNAWVQMAASYPSINKLRELAGTDGVLDATEYLNVNISPVTTAEYALIVGSKLPTGTDAERQYALVAVNARDKLARAGWLHKMLGDINVDLPSKYKTTLEMLLDYEYSRGQLNIFRATGERFESELSELQQDQQQSRLSNQPVTGKFWVSGDDFNYLVDLNEDGTGHLLTSSQAGHLVSATDWKYRESSLKWVRKGADIKLTFEPAINYGQIVHGSYYTHSCQQHTNSSDCSIKLENMLVTLLADNEVGKIANITLNAALVKNDDSVIEQIIVEHLHLALVDRQHLYKLTKEELVGHKWYTNQYSYVFNSNGTVDQTAEVPESSSTVNWKIEDGYLTLDGDTAQLLPLYPEGPGFVALELFAKGSSTQFDDALQRKLFIKAADVSMTSSDWIGRWHRVEDNSFYSAIDYYSNQGYRDGFETQALGSWSVVSNSHVRGFSNGSWRMEHELLAINNGRHYMQYCYGGEMVDFKPINCLVEAYVIDKTFSGNTFWESWSHPLFQETGTLQQWRFNGYSEIQRPNLTSVRHEKVASNKLFSKDSGKVLEMLSSSKDLVVLCEYDAFTTCEQGTTYNLKRSLEIKITAIGNGTVYVIDNSTINGVKKSTNSYMFPRFENYLLTLEPSSGYTVTANNIVGNCNGSLSGSYYNIPARDADCEISVTFAPLP